jgi:hypothetical protein
MEKEQPKCFAILNASQVSVNELPEEIQEKIEILNAVIESRSSINANDERELRDWALKVDARDDAVIADLQGYIAKKKQEQNEQQQEPKGEEQQNKPQQMGWGGRVIIENKPKWMFW